MLPLPLDLVELGPQLTNARRAVAHLRARVAVERGDGGGGLRGELGLGVVLGLGGVHVEQQHHALARQQREAVRQVRAEAARHVAAARAW